MRKKLIIIIPLLALLIVVMAVVPIKTNKADCDLGKRFSVILGQYDEFRKAKTNPNELFACPAYIHDDIPNRLYIL